jgi:hypothetical protein
MKFMAWLEVTKKEAASVVKEAKVLSGSQRQ